jgi:facilitated trehalose transporter
MQLNVLVKEDEQKKLEARADGGSTIREFLKPTGYKPLLIISGVFFFQQFSGIYIFLFYSVSFFEAVGTSVNPYIASILIGVIRLVMSLVNTWMLKHFSRRVLIMISATGMGISTFISGLFTYWIKKRYHSTHLDPHHFPPLVRGGLNGGSLDHSVDHDR